MLFSFQNTFDSTTALAGMFIWITFSYLQVMLNCDLQRTILASPLAFHLMGLTAFFFLFTLIDTNNKTSLPIIFVKTVFVYILFVLLTKSKWYFAVPVIALLLADQSIKKNQAINEETNKVRIESTKNVKEREQIVQQEKKDKEWQESTTQILNSSMIGIILIGSLHYMYIQREQHGADFSFYKFFVGINNCKKTI